MSVTRNCVYVLLLLLTHLHVFACETDDDSQSSGPSYLSDIEINNESPMNGVYSSPICVNQNINNDSSSSYDHNHHIQALSFKQRLSRQFFNEPNELRDYLIAVRDKEFHNVDLVKYYDYFRLHLEKSDTDSIEREQLLSLLREIERLIPQEIARKQHLPRRHVKKLQQQLESQIKGQQEQKLNFFSPKCHWFIPSHWSRKKLIKTAQKNDLLFKNKLTMQSNLERAKNQFVREDFVIRQSHYIENMNNKLQQQTLQLNQANATIERLEEQLSQTKQ